jgi:hypothetical protein
MLYSRSHSVTGSETDVERLESLCWRIRDHLESRRRLLNAEIRHYPTPITRCDTQFDQLLDQRAGLVRALRRIDDRLGAGPVRGGYLELIEEFLGAPAGDDVEGAFRTFVRAALSEIGP